MQMPIPDDWNGEDFCRWSICWPDSIKWQAILSGLIEMPTQGRFWDFDTGNFLSLREQFKTAYDYNFELKESIMACGDTSIGEGLQAIAQALASNNNSNIAIANCGGGGGLVENQTYCFSGGDVNIISYVSIPGNPNFPVFGTQETPPIPETGYPEGYQSAEEYDADKCAKATKLVNDWIASVRFFGEAQWTAGVIGAAAIIACLVGLITVPPAVIPLLLFALTANQTVTALLISLSQEMEDDKANLICILYDGDNTDAIISLLADALDALISLIPGGSAAQVFLMQVALWLMNEDTLNVLFTQTARNQFPEADCSNCADCMEIGIENLTVNGAVTTSEYNDPDLTMFTDGATSGEVAFRADIFLRDATNEEVFCERWVTFVDAPGITDPAGGATIYDLWGAGNSVQRYSSDTPPAVPILCDAISIRSGSDGSVSFTLSVEEP